MFFKFRNRNQTIKTLRKNRDFTAQELAVKLKVDNIDILKIDNMKLKDVPEPLKSKLLPVLRGDYLDNVPW